MNWLRGFAPPALVIAIAVSAISVVVTKQRQRSLLAERQQLAGERDRLQTEYNQLRLEQGAIAAHGRIEAEAVDRLGMQDPGDYLIVEAGP